MSIAHDEPTMELIRARLANSERALGRVLRAFYRLATFTPEESQPSAPNEDDQTLSPNYSDRLYMQHAAFLIELNTLTRSLSESKGVRMLQMTARELEGLEREKIRLESEALAETSRIAELELELEDARRERKNKIQYEEIGKEVRRFGDRFQSAGFDPLVFVASDSFGLTREGSRIDGLAKEINTLLEEQRLYAERWKSRRDQFDTVVLNLEVLQESIREEKADADRKNALNDDDVDDDDARAGEEDEADRSGTGEPNKAIAEADASLTLGTPSAVPPVLDEAESAFRPTTLNPCASTFFPDPMNQDSAVSTPDNRSGARSHLANGTPQPLDRPSSRMEQYAMELDASELHDNVNVTVNEDGVYDDTTMEDGEEREEVEEGQEMERD
ncbi:hypothetical protein CROQUDRAFT_105345 [Cronartium quercuum f. sp. fusiforme G11]|uniref:Uncharacterized protein n=1 Tax=Cronartium quercuum f. sp. fusiforme G11 TaxID=708437 RepID=A0A9P6TEM3_9BASI|nr:hypothetical protein CROQUDRAFT_105345 [Cronartium quercuum f. sp. fusiforme G11]